VDVPVVVVVSVGVASTITLAVMLAATIKQMKILSRSLVGLGEAVSPRLREIRGGADEAERRVQVLTARQAEMAERRARRTAPSVMDREASGTTAPGGPRD
jgi:hypothetical protein